MQWSPRRGGGFTSATPWEGPQADSLTTTVEGQQADPGSLLNLYRRLIHLRAANEALATGRLVTLAASSPSVAAYLRRAGEHAVLVVANLGSTAVSGASIAAAAGVLQPGRYMLTNLLGGADGALLEVGLDGGITQYLPGVLTPEAFLVFELVKS
jgi:glycosidase